MEKFCLKTVDYQTNISKSFQNLRNQDDFCDVTLVGEDFKQVTAHKVVLSSLSSGSGVDQAEVVGERLGG